MKLFRIKESKPVTQVWYYTVKAETEKEAIEKIQDGEVEADDYELEDNWYDPYENGDYECEEVELTEQ